MNYLKIKFLGLILCLLGISFFNIFSMEQPKEESIFSAITQGFALDSHLAGQEANDQNEYENWDSEIAALAKSCERSLSVSCENKKHTDSKRRAKSLPTPNSLERIEGFHALDLGQTVFTLGSPSSPVMPKKLRGIKSALPRKRYIYRKYGRVRDKRLCDGK